MSNLRTRKLVNEVLDARKTLGTDIYVSEDVTRLKQTLAYEARCLVRANTLDKTWTFKGNVYAKFPGSDDKFEIARPRDLNAVRAGNKPEPLKR